MCFIVLRKARDSVDHTLVWKVLACYVAPVKMNYIISQFHDGIRARGRHDSGGPSVFDVKQGLCYGCVIAHVFTIFFAVMVRETFDRFSIGRAAVDDFIRIATRGGKIRDVMFDVF